MTAKLGFILWSGPPTGVSGQSKVIGVMAGAQSPEMRKKARDLAAAWHLSHYNEELVGLWKPGESAIELLNEGNTKMRYHMESVQIWT